MSRRSSCFVPVRWIPSIDILRGFAALSVVLYHLRGFFYRGQEQIWGGNAWSVLTDYPLPRVISYLAFGFGFLGVPLFFVISGACIHLPFAGNEKPLEPKVFTVRRFFRLYPAYLLTILFGFIIKGLSEGFGQERATIDNLIGHLFFWTYGIPPGTDSLRVTAPLWSIYIEVQFYVFFALTLPLLRRWGFMNCALMGLVFGGLYTIVQPLAQDSGYLVAQYWGPKFFAPARYGEWLLGAWIAEQYMRGTLGKKLRWLGSPSRCIAFGWMILVVSMAVIAASGGALYWTSIPAAVAFTFIVAGMMWRDAIRTDIDEQRISPWRRAGVWLGSRSYSLYLTHLLVFGVVGELMSRLLGIGTKHKDMQAGTGLWFLVTLIVLAVALVAADAAFRLVEAPSHKLARTLARRMSRPQLAAQGDTD